MSILQIPYSSDIEDYIENKEYKNGIWALVEIDISKLSGKAKRINITLPERILRQIDKYANEHGGNSNRSGFLVDASLEYLVSHRG